MFKSKYLIKSLAATLALASVATVGLLIPTKKVSAASACVPDEVVRIAKAEVGYYEKKNDDSRYLYSKTSNKGNNNYTKYTDEINNKYSSIYGGKISQPIAWCDVFVDWCFIKAYGLSDARRLTCQTDKNTGGTYCWNSMSYYGSQYHAIKTNNVLYYPEKGDQMFFWGSQNAGHTGIVVDRSGSIVTTVEGNTYGDGDSGERVMYKTYNLNDSRDLAKIRGVARPNYDYVTFSNVHMDTTNLEINQGCDFWGTVTFYKPATYITARVCKAGTNTVVLSAGYRTSNKVVNLYSTVNNDIHFGQLEVGDYDLCITAHYDGGSASITPIRFYVRSSGVIPSGGSRNYVTKLYQVLLNRKPSANERDGWAGLITANKSTAAQVARGFVESGEFIGKGTSNKEYVTLLYRALLNREPDASGLNSWVSYLNQHMRNTNENLAARRDVLTGFVRSSEFQSKIRSMYNITPGT